MPNPILGFFVGLSRAIGIGLASGAVLKSEPAQDVMDAGAEIINDIFVDEDTETERKPTPTTQSNYTGVGKDITQSIYPKLRFDPNFLDLYNRYPHVINDPMFNPQRPMNQEQFSFLNEAKGIAEKIIEPEMGNILNKNGLKPAKHLSLEAIIQQKRNRD